MKFVDYVSMVQAVLLFLIAVSVAYIAYQLRQTFNARRINELYKKRLAIYRDIITLLSVISQDGDISRDELLSFRSKTHESTFLFDKAVADYINEIYERGLKLRSSNALLKGQELPIGEERDKITVENSRQLIWFGDQPTRIKQKIDPYLNLTR